jgi:two-component system alkaline phosphatase synthesis response regulator PhoP
MATVLVIDDEPAIVDILRSILEEEGYNVITAANGRQGLDLIAASRPDVVICDVMMPLLDGRALCRAVELDPGFHLVPVVLMSAVQNIISRTDCKYAAYIQKPFDLDSILNTVAKVLEAKPEINEAAS